MLMLAIVEDEENEYIRLRDNISRYCGAHDIAYNIQKFTSAVDFLKNYRPVYDIIFMDIMLPNVNGIKAAKELRKYDDAVTLIFVTNMANLAVKGYEVEALDFIVKPVKYDSFAMKMERAINSVRRRKSVDVSVRVDRSIKVISAAKIFYIEVSHHSIIIHTDEGELKTRGTLEALEKQLEKENFVRCNACYLVNMKYIKEIIGEDVVVAGDVLKISRAKKKSFMQAFANYLGNTV